MWAQKQTNEHESPPPPPPKPGCSRLLSVGRPMIGLGGRGGIIRMIRGSVWSWITMFG